MGGDLRRKKGNITSMRCAKTMIGPVRPFIDSGAKSCHWRFMGSGRGKAKRVKKWKRKRKKCYRFRVSSFGVLGKDGNREKSDKIERPTVKISLLSLHSFITSVLYQEIFNQALSLCNCSQCKTVCDIFSEMVCCVFVYFRNLNCAYVQDPDFSLILHLSSVA